MSKQILTFRELREAKGYTQESLGKAVGLRRLAIAKYESKQAEPKLGNFLKIARVLEVSLAELALAMGHEVGAESLQVVENHTPAQNEALEQGSVQVFTRQTPAKKQTQGKGSGSLEAIKYKTEPESVQVLSDASEDTPADKGTSGSDFLQVVRTYTPAKRRAKGKGTGFIEERLVKRGNKQYKQYWFHWQKSEPGKKRVLARSKYIPKRLVARIIAKNNRKLPVKEILRSLGVNK